MMKPEEFQDVVLRWFDRHGRKTLPWQIEPTPYRVWVSEIMLQQTQAATVMPYFRRFMQRFPVLQDLAAASEDEVLGYWSGLGYYTRARNLHKAARIVLAEHEGELPADLQMLARLPGIGRSTAGAILSLGFGQRAAILDGNVKRVLSRYAAVGGWPGDPRIARELWEFSEMLTPRHRVGDYTQAMMDVGAMVCTRTRPRCLDCPLQTGCLAFRLELTAALPVPRPKRQIVSRRCWMLVLRNGKGEFYLEKRPAAGIWGGLWSCPEFESPAELKAWLALRGIAATLETMPERRHTFSHFHLDYIPLTARAKPAARIAEAGAGWMRPDAAAALPAPIRRLMLELAETGRDE